jgi:hypothetical protein
MNKTTILKILDSVAKQIERAQAMLKEDTIKPAKKENEPIPNHTVCLYCEQPITEGKITRGVHYSCYVRVKRLINEGKITDQKLVTDGRILPPSPGGRKSRPIPYEQSLGIGLQSVAEPQAEETPAPQSTPQQEPRKRKPRQK